MPASNERQYTVDQKDDQVRVLNVVTGEEASLSPWLAIETAGNLNERAKECETNPRVVIYPADFGLPAGDSFTAAQAYKVVAGLLCEAYKLKAKLAERMNYIVQPWQESGPVSLDDAAREVLQVGREGEPVAGRVYSGVLGEAQVYRIR